MHEYIEQRYPALFELFAELTQGEEYSESELCHRNESERVALADRLQATISNAVSGKEVSGLIDGISSRCYYAELTGFILGFRKAAALFRESGTERL